MDELKLFLMVLGATPSGRNIEQHDVMFTVARDVADTYQKIVKHWPVDGVHIDAYVVVSEVDGFKVHVASTPQQKAGDEARLYFINLGGYLEGDIEEYHKKLVIGAPSAIAAKKMAGQHPFFAQGLQEKNACPHYDDQFPVHGFNIDGMLEIDKAIEAPHSVVLQPSSSARWSNNKVCVGYFPLNKKLGV